MNQPAKPIPRRAKPEEIQAMFDAIAPTYDVLNHVLSFGMDFLWRWKAIQLLKEKKGGTFLDIASGSGDIALAMRKLNPKQIVASDFSFNMLRTLQQKVKQNSVPSPPHLVACDALNLPFTDEIFDATTVAFGIRNFSDRLQSLKEMNRVLKPGGISLILELTTPTLPGIKQAYSFYSLQILPMVGELISQHNSAYSYLPSSISNFPPVEEFSALMTQAGFKEVRLFPLSFGVATIFIGRKKSV